MPLLLSEGYPGGRQTAPPRWSVGGRERRRVSPLAGVTTDARIDGREGMGGPSSRSVRGDVLGGLAYPTFHSLPRRLSVVLSSEARVL